jgi:hypothetical protein
MTKHILRLISVTLLLLTLSAPAVLADGSLPPPPLCPPGCACPLGN